MKVKFQIVIPRGWAILKSSDPIRVGDKFTFSDCEAGKIWTEMFPHKGYFETVADYEKHFGNLKITCIRKKS